MLLVINILLSIFLGAKASTLVSVLRSLLDGTA